MYTFTDFETFPDCVQYSGKPYKESMTLLKTHLPRMTLFRTPLLKKSLLQQPLPRMGSYHERLILSLFYGTRLKTKLIDKRSAMA